MSARKGPVLDVYLSDWQKEVLVAAAVEDERSPSALVRRAIDAADDVPERSSGAGPYPHKMRFWLLDEARKERVRGLSETAEISMGEAIKRLIEQFAPTD